MKIILPFVAIFFIALTVNAQEFKFEPGSEVVDYGTVGKGSDKIRVIKFTNIGEAPLIIDRVQSTCGCTVPKKPEKPVMPGEKGEIEVSYDTNRVGRFGKAITIYSNATEKVKSVKIKGVILADGAPAK